MKHLNKYLESLKDIFGSKLKSIFMYGSCASSGCNKNINLMVITDEITFDELKKCSRPTNDWIGAKNPMPVFISLSAWRFSNDTYAMEYADIKDNYSILYGEDYIKDIQVERDDLRLQCEMETKNLLMRLRAYYLKNAGSKIRLKASLVQTHKTLMVIFRTLLRLNYTHVPKDDIHVITLACQSAGVQEEVFLNLLNNKTKEHKISDKMLDSVYSSLFKQIRELLGYVNSL